MTENAKSASVTSYLCTKGAAEAIDFYAKAFGAVERYRIENGDGTLGHAEVVIGETTIMLSDEAPSLGVVSPLSQQGSSASFILDVPDCDVVFQRALDLGARMDRPLKDEPYGRGGWLTDPFGHRWSIMTSNPNFKPEDMQ